MSSICEDILANGVITITGECKGCDACVKQCPTGAITVNGLGTKHAIDPEKCVNCGRCLVACPFGRIQDVSMVEDVKAAIAAGKTVVVQPAPAVRVALAEAFGAEVGTNAEGKMFSALRELGFTVVYDTLFSADLTIMEEGYELLGRIFKSLGLPGYENAGVLPQFTSCCPGWVRYAELLHPEILPNLSTAKSPMMMLGALIKTYGAKNLGVNPADVYSVAIMPCTAKKFEASRPEFISSGYQDVDAVITTRELAEMIAEAGIDFASLPEGEVDKLLGTGSGAGVIFGATGGVMEAALRTAYAVVSGEELAVLEIDAVRGEGALREATITIPLNADLKAATGAESVDVKVAIVSGVENVEPVIEQINAGTCDYHFIEVMNCPGGCINGGGQPIEHSIF